VNGEDQAGSMPPPAPLPLAGYERVTSSDISVLHDAVEPLAIGHDLQARDSAVPLDGVVNGLSLESVSLVWVRYGGRHPAHRRRVRPVRPLRSDGRRVPPPSAP
jgi:hypothetical protein